MRPVIAALSLFILASAAHAQSGPSAARLISRPMPSLAPSGVQTFSAEAKLGVSSKGRVSSVELVSGSGDSAFDKQWQKMLAEWRFVPAVDASGEPVFSLVTITYRNTGLTDRPEVPGGGEPPVRNALSESQRVEKISCKDFLWEYYIVTNAVSRRLALLDPLLKTPQIMFITEAQLNEAQQKRLRDRYDDLVNDAAKRCRDNLEAAFWPDVFKPTLQASLAD